MDTTKQLMDELAEEAFVVWCATQERLAEMQERLAEIQKQVEEDKA